jgi:hypothetical protein
VLTICSSKVYRTYVLIIPMLSWYLARHSWRRYVSKTPNDGIAGDHLFSFWGRWRFRWGCVGMVYQLGEVSAAASRGFVWSLPGSTAPITFFTSSYTKRRTKLKVQHRHSSWARRRIASVHFMTNIQQDITLASITSSLILKMTPTPLLIHDLFKSNVFFGVLRVLRIAH